MAEVVWSISEVNSAVRELLENSLMPFWLKGEVGTLNVYSSGHVYLTLKDRDCQLKCTFFRGAEQARSMNLAVGMQIEAFGKITVYAQRGEYQFNIKSLRVAGAGSLQQQFEEIKNRLAAEGLFDPARKLPLPQFPQSVGVITSSDGAAVRDFVNVAMRRAPHLNIKIHPAVVQGNNCAESVIHALDFFNRDVNAVDVVVITRGGGSMEDLWGFNSEALARAIAASRIPVVRAIGHEIDFTIADFAASLRAPTPSAAAELVAPDMENIRQYITQGTLRLQRSWEVAFLRKKSQLAQIAAHRVFREPEYLLLNKSQQLDELADRLQRAWREQYQKRENLLQMAVVRLQALDPGNVLKRGFAILRKNNGAVVDSVNLLERGDKVTAQLADGSKELVVE